MADTGAEDRRFQDLDETYEAVIHALQAQRKETQERSRGLGRPPQDALLGTLVVLDEARKALDWLLVTEIELMKRERQVTWSNIARWWCGGEGTRQTAWRKWRDLHHNVYRELKGERRPNLEWLKKGTTVLRKLSQDRRDPEQRRW